VLFGGLIIPSVSLPVLADTFLTISIDDQSFNVIQQSPSDAVTTDSQAVNQLVIKDYKTVVIVAHRDLAGQSFYSLQVGSIVVLTDSQNITRYEITAITVTGPQYAVSRRAFRQADKIIFITCYTINGDLSGGRLVVTGVRQP